MSGKGTKLRANSDLTRVGLAALRPKDLATFFQKQAPWKSDASFEDDEDDMIHPFLRIITDTTLFTPLNTLR